MSWKFGTLFVLGTGAALAGAAGCLSAANDVGKVTTPLGGDDGGDAGEDEPTPTCDLTKPWSAPTVLAGFDSRDIFSFRPSADENSALLSVDNGGSTGIDFHYASRASSTDPYVIGAPLSELNSGLPEYWPSLSADGKMIFFESQRLPDGGSGLPQIWTATRTSTDAGFGAPYVLGIFEGGGYEGAPYLHPKGKSIYFTSLTRGGDGNFDVFVADVTDFGVVTAVRNLETANSEVEEMMPVASYDERALFYSRHNIAEQGRDVWVVGRSHPRAAFGVPQKVVEVSSTYDDFPSAISNDGCRLYFISNRPVSDVQRYRVWVAEKPPL